MTFKHLVMLLALVSCSGKSGNGTAEASSAADTYAEQPDTADVRQMIVWKSSQGIPLTEAEIDTVLTYFDEADRWTARNCSGISTPEDFNRLDSLYLATFTYLEDFSMVLEANAAVLTDSQFEHLQATARQLGQRVDSLAAAAGAE